MARLLLAAIPVGGKVPGDAISVVPDDHVFSPDEDPDEYMAAHGTMDGWPGLFYVVDVPGLPADTARAMIQRLRRPAIPTDPEFQAHDPEDRFVEIGKRRWAFNEALAHADKQLRSARKITCTRGADFDKYLVDRAGLLQTFDDEPRGGGR